MLRTLAAQSDAFPLARPFRISRGVKTVADVVTVEIGCDGVTGRGEGVPYPRYGESIASALAAIEEARGAIGLRRSRRPLVAGERSAGRRRTRHRCLDAARTRLLGNGIKSLAM